MTNYLIDTWHHDNLSKDWYLKTHSSDVIFTKNSDQFLDGPFNRYNEEHFKLAQQDITQTFLDLFGHQNTGINLIIEYQDVPHSETAIQDALATIPWTLPQPINTQQYTFINENPVRHPLDTDTNPEEMFVTSYTYAIDSDFILQNDFFEVIANRDFPDRTPRWDLPNPDSNWSIYFINDRVIYFPSDDTGAWVTFLHRDDHKSFQIKHADILYDPEK